MMLLTQSAFNVNRDFNESLIYSGEMCHSSCNKSEIQLVSGSFPL